MRWMLIGDWGQNPMNRREPKQARCRNYPVMPLHCECSFCCEKRNPLDVSHWPSQPDEIYYKRNSRTGRTKRSKPSPARLREIADKFREAQAKHISKHMPDPETLAGYPKPAIDALNKAIDNEILKNFKLEAWKDQVIMKGMTLHEASTKGCDYRDLKPNWAQQETEFDSDWLGKVLQEKEEEVFCHDPSCFHVRHSGPCTFNFLQAQREADQKKAHREERMCAEIDCPCYLRFNNV